MNSRAGAVMSEYIDDEMRVRGGVPCCRDWQRAYHSGSDCEGCYPLVETKDAVAAGGFEINDAGEYVQGAPGPYIGQALPVVRFCPWCGVRKPT